MLGEDAAPQRLYIEFLERLTVRASAMASGGEREQLLREARRAAARSKAALRELWNEWIGGATDGEN